MVLNPPEAAGRVRPVILVVDDDPGLRESFRLILDDHCDVLDVSDGAGALETLRSCQVDLVLLDIRLPDIDGIELLERIKALDEQVEVILVTAVQTVRTAVAAMKLGAFDYVTKPFEEEEILALVRRALEKRTLDREVVYLRSELARQHDFEELVGRHPAMQGLYQLIANVARTPVTVLIMGESGTGKELVARAIHRQGSGRERPFVPVNLAAVSEGLLESELFGHEKGAFTGAVQKRLGKFELAHEGTLFLDEVAALRVDLQAKLLRALQERDVLPPLAEGGNLDLHHVQPVVEVLTKGPLMDGLLEVRVGRRDHPHFDLDALGPADPLDLPLLVEHFIRKYNHRFHKQVAGVSPQALAVFHGHAWPGNVRELENVVERSVALAAAPLIDLKDLPLDLMLPDSARRGARPDTVPLKESREQFERQVILRVMERVHWNHSEAARILGLHRNGLKLKLAALGIRRAE